MSGITRKTGHSLLRCILPIALCLLTIAHFYLIIAIISHLTEIPYANSSPAHFMQLFSQNLLAMLYPLDKHFGEATHFIKSVAKRLGTPGDLEHTVRVLKSVFGVLRRTIIPDESLQLISKLPLLIKGIYVDGWNICEPLSEARTLDDFLFEIRNNSKGRAHLDFCNVELAKKKIVAVFNVLKQFVFEGELNDILRNVSREASAIM